jgi:hypothetical protein
MSLNLPNSGSERGTAMTSDKLDKEMDFLTHLAKRAGSITPERDPQEQKPCCHSATEMSLQVELDMCLTTPLQSGETKESRYKTIDDILRSIQELHDDHKKICSNEKEPR